MLILNISFAWINHFSSNDHFPDNSLTLPNLDTFKLRLNFFDFELFLTLLFKNVPIPNPLYRSLHQGKSLSCTKLSLPLNIIISAF